LLLFAIGLEFSIDLLRRLTRTILIGCTILMSIVIVVVALVMAPVGRDHRAAILLGCAMAMSSTVLVFKALAEHGQSTSRAGRRMIAILLYQDVAVVPMLMLVPLLAGQTSDLGLAAAWLLAKSAGLILGVVLLRWAVVHWFVPVLARLRSVELMVLFAIVIMGGLSYAAYAVGLPAPLGALAAGLILSGNRLTAQIDALILPFREAFAAVFFVSLGLLFRPGVVMEHPFFLLVGLPAALVLKFAAGTVAARATGLRWRTSAGVGIGLAEIGEFAFVLAFVSWKQGVIAESDYYLMVVFALVSLALTPYFLRIGLKWAKPEADSRDIEPGVPPAPRTGSRALVIGIGPIGRRVVELLHRRGDAVCAVDLSPVNLHGLALSGVRTVAGDAADVATLERAGAKDAELAVVCVPDDDIAVRVVTSLRTLNRTSTIIVRCRYLARKQDARRAGATAVISEEDQITQALLDMLDRNSPDP
jgi:CPA2 family monovalent cation:H+ antiporter-2